jgi:hypothetical protein
MSDKSDKNEKDFELNWDDIAKLRENVRNKVNASHHVVNGDIIAGQIKKDADD